MDNRIRSIAKVSRDSAEQFALDTMNMTPLQREAEQLGCEIGIRAAIADLFKEESAERIEALQFHAVKTFRDRLAELDAGGVGGTA